MKKHLWRRILTAGCVASLFMTSPGMAVLADELPAPEAASVGATSEETAEDNKIVGDGVTATFDASTGEVVFYSDGGTLWRDWLEKLEIEREAIKAIRVSESSEIVFLPADSSELFRGCEGLTSINLNKFDTSNVTNMRDMFYSCEGLTNLDLSSFDTSNVTEMNGMFAACDSLTNLDLSSFDTSNVTDMDCMFYYCNGLTNLDLSSFDTSNVTEMSRMFNGCNCLEVLKTPKINNVSVELPLAMYDKDGNTYTDLPILSESIVLASSQQLAGETSNPVSGIKFDKDTVIIKKGSSEKLIATVLPNTAFNKNLNWSSSDENVATVNENGLVTAVSEGSADITVTTDDGGFMAVCKVEIAKKIAFKDVADENLWYYDSVYWAVENGVTSGMGEGTFQPMAKLSRAQAVTFLYNLAGRPDVRELQAKEFTDVSNTAWYYNAVKWAVANKITSGYGTGTFQPNATCNRAMIVTFLANYAKAAGTYKEPTTSASFKDVKAKDWFRKSVDWAVENGITSGYGQGTFSPNVTCNRAMMVTFLKKVAELPKV